jgi:hypothetical protein
MLMFGTQWWKLELATEALLGVSAAVEQHDRLHLAAEPCKTRDYLLHFPLQTAVCSMSQRRCC